jgi:hypothetical protein
MGFAIVLLALAALVVIAVIAFVVGRRSGQSKDAEVVINLRTTAIPASVSEQADENDADYDAWEGSFWEASNPKRLRARFEIEYKDGNGAWTKRSVRVREFDNALNGGILMGHCELRDATRTFRFDRIKQCVDLETGELVENVRKYLNDLYADSPERSTEILAEDYLDVLKTIYFVAKADGQYRRNEKEVIGSYLRKLVRDERITAEMIDEVLAEVGVPSMHGFKLAVGNVLKSGQVDPQLLASCCKEIVETQESVHPMEKEALDYIDKKML